MKPLLISLFCSLSLFGQAVSIGPANCDASITDALSGGRFTGANANASYVITFTSAGTPDQFSWAKDGGTASSPIAVTGSPQMLADGVSIRFAATTGHTPGAACTISATAHGSVGPFQFIQRFFGSIFRSTEDKLRDRLSVTDFGACPDASCDTIPAYNRAKAAWAKSKLALTGRPGYIHFPMGTYNADTGFFSLDEANLNIICDPGTELRYTGTASIDAVVQVGPNTAGYSTASGNITVQGCTITGNSHVTGAALHASNLTDSKLSDLRLKDAPIGLWVDYGQTVELDHIVVSQYSGLMTILPAVGIWLDHMNNVEITSPAISDLCSNGYTGENACIAARYNTGTGRIEMQTPIANGLANGDLVSVTGAVADGGGAGYNTASSAVTVIDATHFSYAASNPGLYSELLSTGAVLTRLATSATFSIGSGLPQPIGIKLTSAGPVSIHDGTSQGNATGLYVDSGSGLVNVHNMDMEVNPLWDIDFHGAGLHVDGGIYLYGINVGASPATNSVPTAVIQGVATGQITIGAGANGAMVMNNAFANEGVDGGTITDNGNGTTLLNNVGVNGSTYFPNKIMGISAPGDLGNEKTLGFGTTYAPTTDDPSGYQPAFQTSGDFFKLGTGSTTFPTCDATHGHKDFHFIDGAPGSTGQIRVCAKDSANNWDWRYLYLEAYSAGRYGLNLNVSGGLSGGGTAVPGDTINIIGNFTPGTTAAPVVLTGCTPSTGSACANAGCTSTIAVLTGLSCSTATLTFTGGVYH